MDSSAARALATAVSHSVPNGVVDLMAHNERLVAENARLNAEVEQLRAEKEALRIEHDWLRWNAANGFVARAGGAQGGTRVECLIAAEDRADRAGWEADEIYEMYARATMCPRQRRRGTPYIRPSQR